MAGCVMRLVTFVAIVTGLFTAHTAHAYYISGYAVGSHRACRASDLPGTITEMDKFFASRYFPDDAQKNVLWTNGRVRVAEWAAANDRFESAEAASGYDGSDASLISYIASHGATSNARYLALAGGGSSGCEILSSNMSAGDSGSRYLVLSTCQGLKIGGGSGDNPDGPGENPSLTWANGNAGLNCIFGYSNNMVDSNRYGEYLLQNLATTDDTLAAAFFRASRMVHSSNIPAALCFGPNDETARLNLDTNRRFTEEAFGRGGSAWSYAQSRRLAGGFDVPAKGPVPRTLKTKPMEVPVAKLAKSLLGKKSRDLGVNDNLGVFKSESGIFTFDHRRGAFAWRHNRVVNADLVFKLKDSFAVKIARDFLAQHSINADLTPTYVVDVGHGNATTRGVAQKIVVFHQKVRGLNVLDHGGSVEVTIAGDGSVVALQGLLVEAAMLRLPEWLDTRDIDVASARDQALANLGRQMPGAQLSVVETRVGLDGAMPGDGMPSERLRAVVEVLVEATQGGFARRYAERVPL
jgi:hypothetical protein